MSSSSSRNPYLTPHHASAPPPIVPLNCAKVPGRPGDAVAARERAQHEREGAGKTTHAHERDGERPPRRQKQHRDRRSGTRSRADLIVLRVGACPVQSFECAWPSHFEGAPKRLQSEFTRRKSIVRQGEIDRDKQRRQAGESRKQPALVAQCLAQGMRDRCVVLGFWAAREEIRCGMSDARGIKPMQTCLSDNNRPLGMAAAHQLQDAHTVS